MWIDSGRSPLDRNPLYATGTPRPPAGAPSRGGPRSSGELRTWPESLDVRDRRRHAANFAALRASAARHSEISVREARSSRTVTRAHRSSVGAGDEHLQMRVVPHVREGVPATRDLHLVHV